MGPEQGVAMEGILPVGTTVPGTAITGGGAAMAWAAMAWAMASVVMAWAATAWALMACPAMAGAGAGCTGSVPGLMDRRSTTSATQPIPTLLISTARSPRLDSSKAGPRHE